MVRYIQRRLLIAIPTMEHMQRFGATREDLADIAVECRANGAEIPWSYWYGKPLSKDDYLAARDAQALAPFFAAINLRVGTVVQPDAAAQRRQAYACDITYVTAREVVFDYLRDGLESTDRSQRLLRGLLLRLVVLPVHPRLHPLQNGFKRVWHH